MAELSKLLAFMFKEDKEDILAHYNKLLDEAEDEQALLEEFGSPTKLAVTISRTYNRNERKLSVEADSKADVQPAPVVKAPKPEPEPAPEVPSYADIIEEIRREKAEEQGIEYKPMFFNEEEPPAVEEAPAVEDAPVDEDTPAVEDAPTDEDAPADEDTPADEDAPVAEDAPAGEDAPAVEDTPADEDAPADTVVEIFDELDSIEPDEPAVVYKTNVALLILYLIFAIPIGLVLLAAVTAVGLLLLATAVGTAVLAIEVGGFGISSFSMFADILLCIGVALIGCALALVLLWLGLLVLGRALPGLFRGIVGLGRKFCVREVSANG